MHSEVKGLGLVSLITLGGDSHHISRVLTSKLCICTIEV